MQQHQGGGGGSPYGAPDMGPFSPPAASSAAMPLSSRSPPSQPQQQQLRPSYEELPAVPGAAAGFPDEEMLGGGSGSGASGGNRWPREETLALIRIRSEMDATFRDATLKGPLWEDVSRKLADLGYKRSAKKCKEKFENVHKYYKRTKDGRAGRQDGKSYRFFSELEALHAANAGATPQQPPASSAPQLHAFAAPPVVSAPAPMNSLPPVSTGPMQPAPISSAAPVPAPLELRPHQPLNLQGLSFSSMSSDSDESDGESDDGDDMTAETDQDQQLGSKRKRGGRKKMMSFFEGLLQKVVERQEEMQRRFLDTMEKREAERTAREEAWRRQEVARINREQDQLAQERVAGASRDAAIIAFLQRIGGGTSVVQPPAVVPLVPMPAAQVHVHHTPPPKQPTPQPPQATPPQPKPISASPLQQQPPQQQYKEASPQHAGTTPRDAPPTTPGPGASLDLAPPPASEQHHVVDSVFGGGGEGGGVSSSRWPKAEVHALIQLRMDMYNCYQENGPKAPMWEEISAGMRRLGYSRSSKRCKEKWENINKYYKKVKESNKRRPEDSKTCPYFHQLEAIYRKKQQRQDGGAPAANVAAAPAFAPDQMNQSGRHEIEGKNTNDDKRNNGGPSGGGAPVVPASNRETSPPAANKPEDIVRELTEQQPAREFTTDETDSDDYTDDGEDDGQMQYRIQFQRPNSGGGPDSAPAPATTTAPAVPASAPTTRNTFAAMVQ